MVKLNEDDEDANNDNDASEEDLEVHLLIGDTYHVLGGTTIQEASFERAEGLR